MTTLQLVKVIGVSEYIKEHNKLRIGILIISDAELDLLMKHFSHHKMDKSDLLLWND